MDKQPSSRLSLAQGETPEPGQPKQLTARMMPGSARDLNLKLSVFGSMDTMAKSGPAGGTPMVSRPGKSTIAQYLCFSNGVKQKEYQAVDPMDFTNRPLEEIKERLKLELNVLNEDSSRAKAIRQELDQIDGNKLLFSSNGEGEDDVTHSKPHSRNVGNRKLQTDVNIQKSRAPTNANVSQDSIEGHGGDYERPRSQDQIEGQEANYQYIQPPPKPSVLDELNAQLAPYKPPDSDKQSAFFKATNRDHIDRIKQMNRKGMVDVNYDPKLTQTRKSSVCLVKIDPTSTVKKLSRKAQDICSKGVQGCRHSNKRLVSQLNRLSAMSPRIDEAMIRERMENLQTPTDQNISSKPASALTFNSPRSKQKSRSPRKRNGAKKASKTGLSSAIKQKRMTLATDGNRSSSILLQDVSALRESYYRSSLNNSKAFQLSKGDKLKQSNHDRVLRSQLHAMYENNKIEQWQELLEIQQVNDELQKVQNGLHLIKINREQEAKALEEQELNADEKEKLKLKSLRPLVDKYSEEERDLKQREFLLLERIQKIVSQQNNKLQNNFDYQVNVRKSLASQTGHIGDLKGKGYVEMHKKGDRQLYTDMLPQTSEHRFETINTLPRIASKYKNSDRGFSLEKMSTRDPNFMVKQTFGNLLSSEQKGSKPIIKGNVDFAKMKPRQPMYNSSTKYAANIYTYADSINRALQTGKVGGKHSLFKGTSTMKNQTGRDNKMYFVSDGFNLDTSVENQFTSLMTLNNVNPTKSQPSNMPPAPILPQIKSQTISVKEMLQNSASKLQNSEKIIGMSTFRKNPSMVGSAMGLNATERTSAQSKPAFNMQMALKKELVASKGSDLTPPGTSETKDRAGSIGEYESSAFSQTQRDGEEGRRKDNQSPAGKMLDSDGFEIVQMETEDYENLTLEEKILCGFYTAKPSYRGAYPIAQMNMPKT